MKTYKNLYKKIYDKKNLVSAWKKARKGKTQKNYVIEFEKDLRRNLLKLHYELQEEAYAPLPLKTFVLRDPKTRKISKADFRDRIVHHAINNILEPIFEKSFIYNNCAGRKNKGTLFALKRFENFRRKITHNFSSFGYCLKCDIEHYFQNINHVILFKIIKRKIKDENLLNLLELIFKCNNSSEGLPLGNLTSQFFANVYLGELDYFIKHKLNVKYYLRYVDDFVLLHNSKNQLKIWKKDIEIFLKEKLELKLHPEKSRIIPLSIGIEFVGFRNFYFHQLLKQRSIRIMRNKINFYKKGEISSKKIKEIFQGWKAYASWADSHFLINEFNKEIH